MTVLTDVALPQVNVLGSTMAYREAGNHEAPVALSCTGIRPHRTYGVTSFPWLHRWRIASPRILSASANRENPISNIGLPITFATLKPFLKTLGSRLPS